MKKLFKEMLQNRWFWVIARAISIVVAVNAAFNHNQGLVVLGVASTFGCNDSVRDLS